MPLTGLPRRAITALAMLAALAACSCVSAPEPSGKPLRFAVMGNSNPASPFTGYPENLDTIVDEINRDNPVLVLHTGDMVRGGRSRQGVYRKDILRQWARWRKQFNRLSPFLYTAAGNRDSFDGSFDLYSRYTGARLWYSFNCGDVHFVVLHVPSLKKKISGEMIRWLKSDLSLHKKYSGIFVISHRPLMPDLKCKRVHPGGKVLHEIFRMYPVKAVFSGSCRHFLETQVDGVRYIQAGCGGYTREDAGRIYNHYYAAVFDGHTLTVTPRKAAPDYRRYQSPFR